MKKYIFRSIMILFNIFMGINSSFSQCGPTDVYNQVYWTNACIDNDITVHSGGEVIFENTSYDVSPDIKIWIKPGGRVKVINGATLSVNQGGTPKYWKGFLIEGASSLNPQFFMSGGQPYINYANFGCLEISNSTIKHMKLGVVSEYGGIVDVNNSSFQNNLKSFDFWDYTPVKPTGWPANKEIYNASRIEKCNFYWDNWLINFNDGYGLRTDYNGYVHIRVWGEQRIVFGGNYFSNWDINNYSGDGRGIGIEATSNSSFAVIKSNFTSLENNCPQYGPGTRATQFRQLSYGIYYDGTDGDDETRAAVYEAEFHHCKTSISLTEGTYNLIANSDFDFIDDSSRFSGFGDNIRPIFIKTFEGLDWVIYGNDFSTDMEYLNFIIVENSGPYEFPNYTGHWNSIRSNYFINTGTGGGNSNYGVVVLDECGNLCIKCNEFDNIFYDWYIASGANLGQQGSPGLSHGNHFSSSTDNIADYGCDFNIYYNQDESGNLEYPDDAVETYNIEKHGEDQYSDDYCVPVPCSQLFSINENNTTDAIQYTVYPNPAKQTLYLLYTGMNNPRSSFIIYNNLGEIIQSGETDNYGVTQIMFRDISPGLYFIKVSSSQNQTINSLKFIIE